jgi:hypothetical protein
MNAPTSDFRALPKTRLESTLRANHANPANREPRFASGLARLAAIALAPSGTQILGLPCAFVATTSVPRSWFYPADGSAVATLRWQLILASPGRPIGVHTDAHEMQFSAFACQPALFRSQLCGGKAGVQGESVR